MILHCQTKHCTTGRSNIARPWKTAALSLVFGQSSKGRKSTLHWVFTPLFQLLAPVTGLPISTPGGRMTKTDCLSAVELGCSPPPARAERDA